MVDDDRSLGSELGAGVGGELAVWAYPDRHEHEVGREAQRLAVRSAGADLNVGVDPGSSCLIALTRVSHDTSTPCLWSSARTRAPRSGSTVGSTSGSCSTCVTATPRATSASAISRPYVAGSDDHRSLDVLFLKGSHQREGVSHRVQEVHGFARTEVVEAGDRRLDRQRSRGDNQRVVHQKPLVVHRPL